MAFNGAHDFSIHEAHLYDISTKSGLNGIQYLAQHIASDATHDSVKGSNRGTCHPGTRTDIVQDILKWANSDVVQKKIYWLHGSAGVGKSVIAQTAAVGLEKEGKLGASFFFSRTDPTRNNVSRLFSTIAYKLAISLRSKDLRQAVESQIELDPSVVTQSMEIQWTKLIVEPFKSATSDNKTLPTSVVIIDGLDECEDLKHQLDLLQILDEAELDDLPLRIIISSRPEAHIRDSMLEEKANKHELIRSSQVDDEIHLFFSDKFKELRKQRKFRAAIQSAGGSWPSDEDLNTLVAKASGQYVYAKTVLRYVELGRDGTPVKRLRQIISLENAHESFSDLDILYREILSKCPRISFVVLGFLYIMLRQPRHILTPTLTVIDQLLNLEPGELEAALDALHSLVYIPQLSLLSTWEVGEPYFHHASLEDFLMDRQRSGTYYIEMNQMQEQYLKRCTYSLDLIFSDNHVHRPVEDSNEYTCNFIGSIYALTMYFAIPRIRRNILDEYDDAACAHNSDYIVNLTRLKDLMLKLLACCKSATISKMSRKKQLELCCSLETLLFTISTIGGYYLVMCNQTVLSQVDESRLRLFSDILDIAICSPYITRHLRSQLLSSLGRMLERHCIVPSSYQFQDIVAWDTMPSFHGGYAEVFCGVSACHKVCQKRYVRYHTSRKKPSMYKFSPHEIFVARHFRYPTLLPFYGIEMSVDREEVWPISPFLPTRMSPDLQISQKEKLLLIADMIRALKYLHMEGIIAGFVKPSHILISANRRGYFSTTHNCIYSEKLFGSADIDELKAFIESLGAVIRYTSPERLALSSESHEEDIMISENADTYSLSMIIYVMLTRHIPFYEIKNDSKLLLEILHGKLPSFAPMEDPCWAANGGPLTTEIRDLLMECWNRDPNKRPSLDEIYDRMHLEDIEDTRPPDDWPLADRFNDLKHSTQFITPEAIEDMFAMVKDAMAEEEQQ